LQPGLRHHDKSAAIRASLSGSSNATGLQGVKHAAAILTKLEEAVAAANKGTSDVE
jgi:hypothetical protein